MSRQHTQSITKEPQLGIYSHKKKMIENLRGILAYKSEDSIVIEIRGIGYHINIPGDKRLSAQELGATIQVYTHLIHKEDLLELYGFRTREERALFRQLLGVSGVGARLGLKILGALSSEQIITAIQNKQSTILGKVSGLGKRKAEKIILELAEKFQKQYPQQQIQTEHTNRTVFATLEALGYKAKEIEQAIAQLTEEPSTNPEERIKEALQILHKSSRGSR